MSWQDAVKRAAEAQPHAKETVALATVPGRVLIVDADYVAYYCAGNNETPPGQARQRALHRLEMMRLAAGAEKVVCHLTANASTKGDRYIVAQAKPYQGQRNKGGRPRNWSTLREFLESRNPAFTPKVWGDREADDGMIYHGQVIGWQNAVIATKDKDLRMGPGLHLNWDSLVITEVPPGAFHVVGLDGLDYGTYWFWWQCLRGDGADNIPGLPWAVIHGKKVQVGEARATALLSTAEDDGSALQIVAEAYKSFYGDNWAYALAEQAALLWMRRTKEAAVDEFADYFEAAIAGTEELRELVAAGRLLREKVEAFKEALP